MTAVAGATWRARADADLLPTIPSRGRVAIEIMLLASLIVGARTEGGATTLGAGILLLEAMVAVILVRPWAASRGGWPAWTFAMTLALLTVFIPALLQGPDSATRRLGVELVPYVNAVGGSTDEDPAAATAYAEVKSIASGTPADGLLLPGDRVEAVNGRPLAAADPPADLARQIQNDALVEDFPVTIVRHGAVRDVRVHVPRVAPLRRRLGVASELAKRHVIVATAIRDLLLVAFLLLLARVDGQPLSALGLVRRGALSELVFAVPATAGVFLVQVAAAVPIAILGALTGLAAHEASERVETLSRLSDQTSAIEFLVALVVAATFEEIAFRAFLTPRVRTLTGSWPVATIAVSILFGLGHAYEGTVAVLQTAILGVYFTAVYLARRRVLAAITCHTVFNASMLLMVRVLVHGGALDRLKQLAP